MQKDNLEIHFKSQIGFEMTTPMRQAIVTFEMPTYTWAERQLDELVWKLKRIKSNWNKLTVFLLMIPSILVVLALILAVAVLVKNVAVSMVMGYAGSLLAIMAYYFWTNIFECNPTFLKVKHKGKIYC